MANLLLIAIEWVLRAVGAVGKSELLVFIGPTLAAAGIGLGLPLTCYRAPVDMSPEELLHMRARSLDVVHMKSKVYRGLAWVAIIFLTVVWIGSIVLQNEQLRSQLSLPDRIVHVPMCLSSGLLGYFIGILMSETKERANG